MDAIIPIGEWIIAHWQDLLSAAIAVLLAAIAVAMLVPGDQPEKLLYKIVDFLKKFSRK